jgi:hypothetical protein
MNRSLVLFALLGGASLTALAGSFSCGGSDSEGNGSSGSYKAGFPADRTVGDLTDSDLATLCQSVHAYYGMSSGAKDLNCKGAGLIAVVPILIRSMKTDADLQKACSDASASCETRAASGGDAGASAICGKPTGSCTATVAEYEACATDQSAQLASAAANIPACETLTLAGIQSSLEAGVGTTTAPATPPSCQTLATKCPGLTM